MWISRVRFQGCSFHKTQSAPGFLRRESESRSFRTRTWPSWRCQTSIIGSRKSSGLFKAGGHRNTQDRVHLTWTWGDEIYDSLAKPSLRSLTRREIAKYAHTLQATALKLILFVSQVYQWDLAIWCCVSSPQHSNHWVARTGSPSSNSISRARSLATQTSALWSWRFSESIADIISLKFFKRWVLFRWSQSHARGVDIFQYRSISLSWHTLTIWLFQVGQCVKKRFKDIQKTLSLKHVEFLSRARPVQFLGRTIKERQDGQVTMGFPQKFRASLLWNIRSRVTTTGVKAPVHSKAEEVKCDSKVHSMHTAVGELVWVSELRDEIKYPTKEMLRAVKSSENTHCNFGASSQVCQQHEGCRLHHRSSSSSSRCLKAQSCSRCQLFRFRLGKTSEVKTINELELYSQFLESISIRRVESGEYPSFLSGIRTQCDDSSRCRLTGHQAFRSGVQLKAVVTEGWHCCRDGFIGKKTMVSTFGMSRRSKHVQPKHLRIQDILRERATSLAKVGVLAKFVQAAVLSQNPLKFRCFSTQIYLKSFSIRVYVMSWGSPEPLHLKPGHLKVASFSVQCRLDGAFVV